MSNLPQITSLLTQLASHLQSPDPQNPIPHLISTLNHSLNLNQTQPRVRVLDKALSLMCFKAPQVFECEIQCLVDTILSVLCSSVSCRVLGSGKEELLRVGSLISGGNCEKLMEVIVGICAKLEQYDTHKQKLLSSIIRVAVSASCYQSYIPLAPILCLEPRYEKRNCISELRNLLHEEGSFNNEIPLRLLLWDLDPLTLKHDISNVLHELVERPFINLRKELRDKITWRTITICLVLSPDKFIETRTLLHSWFLKTGMSSILELQNKLVSSTLDVLARPMQWSISMDVGLKLPFSSAYFPNDHHFVVTLTGPISDESLLGLVHHITEKHSHPILKDSSAWTKRIDHKSTWATLMAFHEWFLFASVLLFFKKESCPNFLARCVTCGAKEYCAAAARFLAFCINPTSEANLNLLVGYLVQISESWILKQSNSHMQSTKSGRNKSFRKPRVRGTEKDSIMTSKEITSRALSLWLTDFHDYHMKYWTGAKMQHSYTLQWKSLFQKVPLGIFVGCSDLDEVGCELLLHYAATGEILQTTETQSVQLEHVVHEPKWAEDAVAGASLVFDVCETVEDMSLSMFETEESRIEFVCQLKLRSAEFMVKCIRKLLQVTFDEKSLVDLHGRLEEWSNQGGIAQSSKALKDVLTDLDYRLHSP